MAIDVNQLIAGFNPSQYGYTYDAGGANPAGWYRPNSEGGSTASSPFGYGTPFEAYLNANGVRMWDPGNPSYGRVGWTNDQAYNYLNPGAETLGYGNQFSNADPSLGTSRFITGGGPPTGDALAGLDYGDNTGINKLISTIGPMLPFLVAGGAGAFAGLGAGAGAGAGGGAGGFADAASGFLSDLPTWAGGAAPGLGEGIGGLSLGGAAAPAIGTAAGAGASAGAGGGFLSDLPAWAGGAGGTSAGGAPNILQQLQQLGVSPQQIAQLVGGGGSGAGDSTGGSAGGQAGGQQSMLQSLLPLLGIGSGLNTLLNPQRGAVTPEMLQQLFAAGQNTYQTSLDPQNALRDRTQQQLVDATRASSSARGLATGPQSAGLENKAVSDFLIDWQNQQLGRQAAGTQAFGQSVGIGGNQANNQQQQQFAQNQTGLNNLTSGFGNLFGGSSGGSTAGTNQIGQWLTSLFNGGGSGGTPGTPQQQPSGSYNPFPTLSAGNAAG